MILITGAGGLSGQAVTRALVARGVKVRGLARHEEAALQIRAAGAAEVVYGDLRDPDSLRRAMDGVRVVYHICPRLQADEHQIGLNVIAAARLADVRLFIYHSVIHPPIADIAFHWEKMKVELEVITSGLPFTIIQPTNLMQNILWTWKQIIQAGVYTLPYRAEARLTWVDVDDVGEAAAHILTEPGHIGATYELAGPDGPLSRHEVCEILSRVVGRRIRAETQSIEEYIAKTLRFALREPREQHQIQTMFEFYHRHGLPCGNPKVLQMLIEREPTTYETCLKRIWAKWKTDDEP